jgi:hypothetical protein
MGLLFTTSFLKSITSLRIYVVLQHHMTKFQNYTVRDIQPFEKKFTSKSTLPKFHHKNKYQVEWEAKFNHFFYFSFYFPKERSARSQLDFSACSFHSNTAKCVIDVKANAHITVEDIIRNKYPYCAQSLFKFLTLYMLK